MSSLFWSKNVISFKSTFLDIDCFISGSCDERREIDEERDKYAVIASDGVWDVVNIDLLSQMAKEENAAQSLCERIVKAAIEGDTRDNVSCIVIKL